jgi:baseplate J-like protein
MPNLATQNSTTIDSNWAAAVQGACATLLDFTVGSILRAIGQAQKGVTLWLQGLVLQLLAATRLGTSSGADVDSFVADFGLTRLPAIAASGAVTFSRFTPTNQAVVPVGAVIQTVDGTQAFTVVANPANGAFSVALNGYVIAPTVTSVTASVQAVNPGSQGNISAATLTVLQTGISGVDTATNASAFTTGIDAEADLALKARFLAFFASLSNGTEAAIQRAVSGVNQNLQLTIVEQPLSSPNVAIYVDDGSGSIGSTLLTAATNAANAVRAAGISYGVFAATKVTANVNMTITTAAGFVHATVVGQVALALAAYINRLGMSLTGPNPLSYMMLGTVAFGIAGVTDVTNVTLNSGTADLTGSPGQTIKAGTIAVS